jgi:hypothetical protein
MDPLIGAPVARYSLLGWMIVRSPGVASGLEPGCCGRGLFGGVGTGAIFCQAGMAGVGAESCTRGRAGGV